jgi:Ribonuclease G/E
LGSGTHGFLRDWKGLAPGDTLLVQVSTHAEGGKATPVARRILFKSKWAIATPGAPGVNISRQIREEETRVALQTALADLDLPDGTGLIVRSAAQDAPPEEVVEDAAEMLTLCAALTAENTGPPELLLDGPDAHHLAWREWGTPPDLDTAPGCLATRGLLEEIDALRRPAVPLSGGASMWVEPTRALVAVDVNTGGDTSAAAGLKANIAALRDLPRQLRLRGLGGQIVVDPAPTAKKDRKQIEQVLRAAVRTCPIETTFVGWTPLGHLELQRKRERLALSDLLTGDAA